MNVRQQITELIEKLNGLEKLYEQVNSTMQFNIGIMWGIVGGVFAIIGFALYFIGKNMVSAGIEKGIKDALSKMHSLEVEIDKIHNVTKDNNEVIKKLTAQMISHEKSTYEMGGWTPLLSHGAGSSVGMGCGQYIKIANIVFISGEVYARDVETDVKGQVFISGFPFPAPPSGQGHDMHLFNMTSRSVGNFNIAHYNYIFSNGSLFLQYQSLENSGPLLLNERLKNNKFIINGFYCIRDDFIPNLSEKD